MRKPFEPLTETGLELECSCYECEGGCDGRKMPVKIANAALAQDYSVAVKAQKELQTKAENQFAIYEARIANLTAELKQGLRFRIELSRENTALSEQVAKLRAALLEIAAETGTPYATIALKALGED